MSMISEFIVLGAIGSVVLGPKRTARLMTDASRWMQKFKSVQQDFTRQIESELSASSASVTLPGPEPASQQRVSSISNPETL